MKHSTRIFISDYGESRVGPLFESAYAAIDGDLAKSRRTKAYKLAKAQRDDLDQCLMTLARLAAGRGEVMEVTP